MLKRFCIHSIRSIQSLGEFPNWDLPEFGFEFQRIIRDN
ncbi:hypothetical protein LEP1GSC199_2619 [Leptospira vanthielii serovar Holland str. Waz Holland = ATCC 700522]|uniref:Uncharacterized protein n=1 Tax=Leptospira vanthielii serovar Holland str. Waz Holland = ATCC 700522 TaxID=1218591 RepID=N1W8Z0_9LEPT|nr:hypothetical protein LEP1GSC199_2619 [Leptospira vanthielii serovar Holland str. Waz Holland = ATCC 700522]